MLLVTEKSFKICNINKSLACNLTCFTLFNLCLFPYYNSLQGSMQDFPESFFLVTKLALALPMYSILFALGFHDHWTCRSIPRTVFPFLSLEKTEKFCRSERLRKRSKVWRCAFEWNTVFARILNISFRESEILSAVGSRESICGRHQVVLGCTVHIFLL